MHLFSPYLSMNLNLLTFATLLVIVTSGYSDTAVPLSEPNIKAAFAERTGALVVIDVATESCFRFQRELASEKLPPCSTFKIWNTLIGAESGYLTSADQPFYIWDGKQRSITAWNKDLTLKEAFQASCVPAFQNLATRIGRPTMQSWIDKIEYGDRNLAAGIDTFWLPVDGRQSILISPEEQAKLITKLVTGKLPFSQKSIALLKEIMLAQKTERGTLYGKTGSGGDVGWFVGFVESQGMTYSFACVLKGKNVMGKDAMAIVETVFGRHGLL